MRIQDDIEANIENSIIEEAFEDYLSTIPPYFYGDWRGIREYEAMFKDFRENWLEENAK